MINWNFDPVLFNLGNFEIRYYGLIFALGFIITFFYLDYLRKKAKLELSKDNIYDLIFYLIIGVILGSRIFEVLFWQPAYYFNNPLEIFAIWNGGLSFHGGLVGAIITAYLFCKKNKFSFLKLADLTIIPTTLALALGRIGNLLNSEIYGKITDVSWCFNFQNVIGCRHPYQIYASLGHLFTFLTLMILKKKQHKEGYLFFIGLFLFGIFRFILDFWREDPTWFSLNLGQYFSVPLILISAYILFKYYRKSL